MQMLSGSILILAAVLLTMATFLAVRSADAADVFFLLSILLALSGAALIVSGLRRGRAG